MMKNDFVLFYLILLCIIFVSFSYSMNNNERHTVLKMHNAFRSHLAKGHAHNSDGGKMPPAKNMHRLSYDQRLERMAKRWGSKCQIKHSPKRTRRGAGENLAMFSTLDMSKRRSLLLATSGWYAELRRFGIQSSLLLSETEFSKGIGHWTQMAWAKTTKIGCAVARCPKIKWKTYVVCNYYPGGNIIDHHVYEMGTTCSGCKGHGKKCTDGLCDA